MSEHDALVLSLQRELQAKDRALSDFAYSVSHDLKAHLRHIKAYVQVLREDMGEVLQPEWQAHMDVVQSAAQKMGQQLDGLMALAQIDRQPLACLPLDMNALIQDARQALAADGAGRDVQWQIASDFPALQGDIAMVRQIWIRLLSNALKYTQQRAPALITVAWERDAQGCWCYVQDNGVGIESAQIGRLFKAFQKLHASDDGLGMGLAMVRRWVERQGGQVQARALPQGSWFGFCLPEGQTSGS